MQDNGPGIVKAQVPKIFGKLLYGSKFHRLKQSRGQQGIGISAAAMYGQLTTGKPIRVTSRVGKGKAAHVFDIQLDTRKNEPVVTHDETLAQWHQDHGTRVELEIVANWQQGQRFVNRYVEHTALANPHATLHYTRPVGAGQRANADRPGNETLSFPRATTELPKEAVEIKPHPHGVELGALMLMAQESKSRDVRGFLQSAFSRVSASAASDILSHVPWGRKPVKPRALGGDRSMAEQLHKAIGDTKLMSPPTNCLSPIGDELMRKGLVSFLNVIESEGDERRGRAARPRLGGDEARRRAARPRRARASGARAGAGARRARPEEGVEKIKGHNYFIATVTRSPKVYRGNPFQVEVGLAYGGSWPADKTIELFRFANRVPLLFQRGACGITEAIVKTDWRNYLLSQPKGSLPVGPMALLVHIASVWVPFTSESKEAVAHYPDIIKEIQLAAQECGRKLATFIRKRKAEDYQAQRRSIFELYIEEVAAGDRQDHEAPAGPDQARVPEGRAQGDGRGAGGRGEGGAREGRGRGQGEARGPEGGRQGEGEAEGEANACHEGQVEGFGRDGGGVDGSAQGRSLEEDHRQDREAGRERAEDRPGRARTRSSTSRSARSRT